MANPTYLNNFEILGGSLPRGTRGLLRGIVPKLVCVVRLGERVGRCNSSVRPKSEAIGPALDNFSGKCTEPEHSVKLVNNPEGTGPPKL